MVGTILVPKGRDRGIIGTPGYKMDKNLYLGVSLVQLGLFVVFPELLKSRWVRNILKINLEESLNGIDFLTRV